MFRVVKATPFKQGLDLKTSVLSDKDYYVSF